MKKTVILAAIIAGITASASVSAFAAAFPDLPESHWAYAAVMSAAERDIINGYPNGEFKPSDIVTYGEFIKMAHMAQGGEPIATDGAAGGDWALPYHEAAVESGLYSERDIAGSALSHPIPREYMALILSGVAGKVDIANYDELRENLSDVAWDAPHEYDIMKVYSMGLITGYPDKTFRPEGTLTRAEAATVIYRLVEKSARVIPVVPEKPEVGSLEERMKDGDSPGIGRILDNDRAIPEGNLSDIVDNLAEFSGGNSIYDDDAGPLTGVTKYEIIKDYNYKMEVVKNLAGGLDIDIKVDTNHVTAFMIKGRILTELSVGGSQVGIKHIYGDTRYDQDVPTDFSYIGFVNPYASDCMVLIPNTL